MVSLPLVLTDVVYMPNAIQRDKSGNFPPVTEIRTIESQFRENSRLGLE
jgi:hypothetical protein